MCGFAGFWDFKQNNTADILMIAQQMGQRIQHRGPDSSGIWRDPHLALVMAHQRLAIQDLSPHGAQPMQSQCGRWVIAYNGEIYNANDLKAELKIILRGHSDTEILLESIAAFGLKKALEKINGMFAFALWDQHDKLLYLARDRIGIKPLYWGFQQQILFFGSQLMAFKGHPHWKPNLDRDALISYFRFNYIPAPMTIYQDMHKLQPGQFLVVNASGAYQFETYWNLQNHIQPLAMDEGQAIERLHRLLKDAVQKQMVADVSLGAFLSGGIDSSTVVALMQAQSSARIKTFSIGFHSEEYNEAKYAKAIATHLQTDHHELYFSAEEAIKIIPELPRWYDEPFADASQLPTLLVSKMARQHVTVSLSGDGGDELFAGYTRYFLAHKMHQRFAVLPFFLRYLCAQSVLMLRPNYWEYLARAIPARRRPQQFGDKAHKFAMLLKNCPSEFYRALVSMWPKPAALVRDSKENYRWPLIAKTDFIKEMQILDALTYLPDDILTKVDRASMAVSLEARVPLLDHRVVEFAFQLPLNLKIRENKGKWLLRQILYQYVPKELIERPKMGFGVPIDEWLRGPLRDWAQSLLAREKLQDLGLNYLLIEQKWREHLKGQRNWQYPLWGVLMLQAWNENQSSMFSY